MRNPDIYVTELVHVAQGAANARNVHNEMHSVMNPSELSCISVYCNK